MAQYKIHNETLTVCISTAGAEVSSIVKNDTSTEYLWHGDSAYWGRRSPVLFPLVGSLRNKEYTYEGASYSMNQHGFARDMEFTLTKQTDTELTFSLASDETTYAKYPFQFLLHITYTLDADTLKVTWNVKNTDDKTMYFSIGGHPAFLCPIGNHGKQADYSLEFDCDSLSITNINAKGLAMPDKHTLSLNNRKLALTEHLFDNDALVIEQNQSHKVSLLTPEEIPYLTVAFDAPLFGLWSPAKKQAPFVCIEPWYGRCDSTDFAGELKDREYGNTLEAGKEFEAFYTVQIHSHEYVNK